LEKPCASVFKVNKSLLTIFLSVITAFTFADANVCYANSGPPPSILIIVPNAPDDLTITIEPDNLKALRTDKAFERYFTFYIPFLSNRTRLRNNLNLPVDDYVPDYQVKITSADRTFEVVLDTPLKSYNNIFTLELQSQTLTPGKSLSRTFGLLSISIFFTLVIEGIVFYAFGYRRKKSWLVFLIVNLLTQLILNIWLNVSFAPIGSYLIFPLIFGEIFVFVAELFLFLHFIGEHSRFRTASYVILANILSLVAGGYLITVLPI
jgi:hypothetical protein